MSFHKHNHLCECVTRRHVHTGDLSPDTLVAHIYKSHAFGGATCTFDDAQSTIPLHPSTIVLITTLLINIVTPDTVAYIAALDTCMNDGRPIGYARLLDPSIPEPVPVDAVGRAISLTISRRALGLYANKVPPTALVTDFVTKYPVHSIIWEFLATSTKFNMSTPITVDDRVYIPSTMHTAYSHTIHVRIDAGIVPFHTMPWSRIAHEKWSHRTSKHFVRRNQCLALLILALNRHPDIPDPASQGSVWEALFESASYETLSSFHPE